MQWKGRQGFVGRVFAVTAIVIASAIYAAPASAQCSSSASSQDVSNTGTLALLAGTTQQNCTGRTTQLATWMQGHTSDCEPETFDSQGNCFVQNSSGNAVLTIYSSPACGLWNGMSNHYYVENGTQTTIQTNRTTPLFAGQCGGVDCSSYGSDYWWDGSECTDQVSPIIVPTKPGPYRLTSAAEGVVFDIDADGVPKQVSWTQAGADMAFLAIDIDGDGLITSGRELFGNHTIPGITNGWDALAAMAAEAAGGLAQGSVNSDNPLFERLLLWTDRNHNGISEPDELQPASDLFSDIGVGYIPTLRRDQYGNVFRFKGWVQVRTAPGRNAPTNQQEDRERTRPAYDVLLTKQP